MVLQENVESTFLYRTITGSEIVPFGHIDLPIVVLPIESKMGPLPGRETYRLVYRMIKSDEAKRKGFTGLAEWLTIAENEWNARKGIKLKKVDIYDWLNYRSKLTRQNPEAKFLVVYNTSGSNLTSCVLEQGNDIVEINGQMIKLGPIIVESTTYSYETDIEDEAFYLTSILNSPFLNTLLKPLQARGQFGPRHFHKKPLEFPIPTYDPSDETHRKLSDLGKESKDKILTLTRELSKKYKGIGKIRSEIRKALSAELQEIDSIIEYLFTNVDQSKQD